MRPRDRRSALAIAGVLLPLVLVCAAPAAAQTRPVQADPPGFTVRLFGDAGVDQLNASRSFNAIFGADRGPVYGGGVEVVMRSGWFIRAGGWRFNRHGERALRLENRTFRLGIPLTVTILPIEVNAGYRFGHGKRLVPYVGAGASTHSYKETSAFADGDENVNDRFTGYQVLGGLEFRLHRVVGIAGEIQYSSVPDALGAGGLSAEFGETDLGGLIVRARVLFGR